MRKGYRPFRNRAIVCTLIGTGMRKAAVRNIDLTDVDFEKRLINVEEKSGRTHGYKVSRGEISAIEDYVAKERAVDFKKWKSPATNAHGNGRLNARVINTVWNDVCKLVRVGGHTPHDARHAMGRHLIEKTGNIAAVQRQLGHTNAAYSIKYARITNQELADALDDR
jgi:integrase